MLERIKPLPGGSFLKRIRRSSFHCRLARNNAVNVERFSTPRHAISSITFYVGFFAMTAATAAVSAPDASASAFSSSTLSFRCSVNRV